MSINDIKGLRKIFDQIEVCVRSLIALALILPPMEPYVSTIFKWKATLGSQIDSI